MEHQHKNVANLSPKPLFAPFSVPMMAGSNKAWEKVLHLGVRMTFKKGAMIIPPPEQVFDIFYIEKGKVQIVFDTPEGRRRWIMMFQAGSIFNLACSAARQEALGEYVCAEDAVVWRIDGTVLHNPEFIKNHPQLVSCVMRQLGSLVLTYSTGLTSMLTEEFLIRLARFLLAMSIELNCSDFCPGHSQEQIAAMFGVHRTTLARAIQQLKKDCVISCFTRSRIEIIDMEKLKKLAML